MLSRAQAAGEEFVLRTFGVHKTDGDFYSEAKEDPLACSYLGATGTVNG